LTADSDNRKKMLREAIRYKKDAVSFYLKDLSGIRSDDKALFGRLGSIQFEYGEMLNKLCELTGDREHAANALEAFRQAAENFRKLNLVSRSAECQWRSAQAYDALGEYSKAADGFALASEDYKEAALRIPKLKDFYEEYSNYMQAWSEIEKGRYSHEQQEYGLAASSFETAGSLYKSSQRWSYLAANYAAWSKVEHAEESSIDERDEEAFEGFRQSADLFQEAGRSLQSKLGRIEDSNEDQMARDMLKTTELRREYCEARMAIEKARIYSKKGEHNASIQQYGLSIEILETVIEKLESKIDKREYQFIICLSRAWQEMEKAEAEESPQHYDEANQLFEKAKDLVQTEKAKALVLGHSRFCKALEAGARFADTRDMSEHARAMQHLESATNYYLKADFQKASEYTRATRLLFDAYVHMGNAARETDPEKKTRLYMVAEKVLQTSADSYARAGNLSKRKQALKLLETAQDQREIAISLAEILQAPIMASTTAFTVPTSSSEKPVGLEKFEHAEINANMILGRSEYRVGENIELEIELANAGKGQALLTQIEEAFPESFDLTTKPESYRVEGHNINMKGRRLDPLKTEGVKFSVKPKHKGSFTVRPRILYLDENGNTKSHQTESLTITVKELGISGWIKGER
jgi:tetratricopeptide (TPR) repeat protein